MLVRLPEHEARDLEVWDQREEMDALWCRSRIHQQHVETARAEVRRFVAQHPACYAGVSWGKDSVVLAHLIATEAPQIPLVWIRVEPIKSPHCDRVRDLFLLQYPGLRYEEVEVWCQRDHEGWHATGTLEQGIKECERRHGPCHLSGVRGEESGRRKVRMQVWGLSSPKTCAPLGWWKGRDIFAYLHEHNLPVHPAYAMSFGGMLDRDRLRVASLTGKRGEGHGRAEWEQHYYRAVLRRLSEVTPP